MKRLGQIDYEIQQCEQHLDATNKRNTEVEGYAVGYLLVRICAAYETRIRLLVKMRCSRLRDQRLLCFTHWAAGHATQRFNISDITGLLGKFGENYKKSFSDAVNGKPCNAAWDSIYTNRNSVAHGTGPVQMTLADLKSQYEESLGVIKALSKSLRLKEKELKKLK